MSCNQPTINDILAMREALRPFLVPFGESTMTTNNIVDIVRGLVDSKVQEPPLRVTVPAGTNLQEIEDEGENMTLEARIKDVSPDIKEVVVGRGKGVSVESIAQENRVKRGG